MFLRWAKGSVYEVFLRNQYSRSHIIWDILLLCQIKDGNSVAYRGKQRVSIWSEDQVAPAIDGAEEVRKLQLSVSMCSS
jgi:hypothetical protein